MKRRPDRKKTGVPVIGLTGGIASGKSAALREFARLGARVVDADAISRRIMRPGTVVWKKTVAAFGREILTDDRTIDRKALGRIVFADPAKRKKLERITHPAIIAQMRSEIKGGKRSAAGGARPGAVIVDAPLLYEAGLEGTVDEVVVVWTPRKTQIERLRSRDGITVAEAERRLAAQWPLSKKRRLADRVVDNSAAPGELRRQVTNIWQALTNGMKN